MSKPINYSEWKLEREGKRLEDSYVLSYAPKDSDVGVTEYLSPWIARLIKAILLEKCPENVTEHNYGYRREGRMNWREEP